MGRLTFYLSRPAIIDDSLRQEGQNKPKRTAMSSERYSGTRSVRRTLLRTLIERRARGKTPPVEIAAGIEDVRMILFFVSYVHVARQRSRPRSQQLDLRELPRKCRRPRPIRLLNDYFCGDDPANDSPGK